MDSAAIPYRGFTWEQPVSPLRIAEGQEANRRLTGDMLLWKARLPEELLDIFELAVNGSLHRPQLTDTTPLCPGSAQHVEVTLLPETLDLEARRPQLMQGLVQGLLKARGNPQDAGKDAIQPCTIQ